MTTKEGSSLPTNQNARILVFRKSNPFDTFTISKPKDAEIRYTFPAEAEEAERTEYRH